MKFKVGDKVTIVCENAVAEVSQYMGVKKIYTIENIGRLDVYPILLCSGFSVSEHEIEHYGVPDNKLSRAVYPDYVEKDGRLIPRI